MTDDAVEKTSRTSERTTTDSLRAQHLKVEISLLEKSLEAAESLEGLDEWNKYAIPKNRERLRRARMELEGRCPECGRHYE